MILLSNPTKTYTAIH